MTAHECNFALPDQCIDVSMDPPCIEQRAAAEESKIRPMQQVERFSEEVFGEIEGNDEQHVFDQYRGMFAFDRSVRLVEAAPYMQHFVTQDSHDKQLE